MPEFSDADVFGKKEFTDADVFGTTIVQKPRELTDADVFAPRGSLSQFQPPVYSGPDEFGVGEEVRGVVRGLERGGRRFTQRGDVMGIRRVSQLEDDLKAAESDLAKYDKDFGPTPKPEDRVSVRWRNDQVSKIAGIKGELERYTKMAPELAESFSEHQEKIEKLPVTAAQAEFQKKETPWWKFFSNPVELTAITTAESLPQMGETLAAGAGGPVAMGAAAFASSHSSESSSRVTSAMQQQGVDLKNPIAVLEWFKNRSKADPEIAKADLAALGPATFDALSAGIAGRWLRNAVGGGVKPVAIATGKEIGAQMVGGGAGSIAGSLIAGEPVDWKDVVLEMAAELAPGEAMMNVVGEVRADAKENAAYDAAIEENAKRMVDRGGLPAQTRTATRARLSRYPMNPNTARTDSTAGGVTTTVTAPGLPTVPEPKPGTPTRIVEPVVFNGKVNSENLLLIANDVRDRFEQLGLQGRNTAQTDAMLSVLRPMLDNEQPNQLENLSRFFGLTIDETATDMPERYRTVVHPTLSRPGKPSTKAPAPQGPGVPVKLYPKKGPNAPVSTAPTTAVVSGSQPSAPTTPSVTPQAPTGEPVVLNGRAFSKIGGKWFDATSGKQREVKKAGVVSQLESILVSEAAAAAHPSTYDVEEDAPVDEEPQRPRDTRAIDPATGLPVLEADIDPNTLTLSADVPNFKAGAGDTGEVVGRELTGKYSRIGTGRAVVWERADGKREVITGRHRWQLAKRTGIKDFPVQILREADGFTQAHALVLDAEANIKDNQGTVEDYAHYFRNTPYDEAAAVARGLLREAKGRDGFNIGKYAGDDIYALFHAGKIPERQASAIAKAAPNDAKFQAIGINAAAQGRNIGETVARIEAAKSMVTALTNPKQKSLFEDQAEWQKLEELWALQGDYVAGERKRLQDIISTRKSIIRNPAAAQSTGSIKAKVTQAQAELDAAALELTKWENWASDPELKAKVDAAVGNKNAITMAKEPAKLKRETYFHGTQEKLEGALRPGLAKNQRRFLHEEGIWFAPNIGASSSASTVSDAKRYSGDSGTIVEAKITLKNPYYGDVDQLVSDKINTKWLRDNGYDGFVDNVSGSGLVAVLDPSQIQEIRRMPAGQDTGTTDMFGDTVAAKSPEELAEEKRKKAEADALAEAANKKLVGGSIDTTMQLPGTGEALPTDIPLLTQGKPKGSIPSFAARFNRATLLQVPDWVSPALRLALTQIAKANDPLIGREVTADWNRITPKQRQELAARGFVTTSTRTPGQVEIHASQDALAAQRYFKANAGSLATEVPKELSAPDIEAQGVEAIRELVNHPDAKLPQRAKDMILAMLDTPVMRKLDWSKLALVLRNNLEGDFAGLAYPINQIIELSRAASSETFPHEMFHLLYELLPESDRQVVEDLRQEAVAKQLERDDLPPNARELLEFLSKDQTDSMWFGAMLGSVKRPDDIREFYHLINAGEFLSSMAGEKFATDAWTSRNDGQLKALVNRIKAWVQGIVDAVKRVVGKRPDMEQIFRELLAGKHTNRMAATIDEALSKHGSLSKNAAEARNAERLAQTAEDRDVEATHQLAQSDDIVDLLEKHGAGAALSPAARLLGYFDYAGIREVGRRLNNGVLETYRQLKGRITDTHKRNRIARVANTQIERFDVRLKDIQKQYSERLTELSSPSFLRLAMRESVAKANADAQGIALRNASSIISSALQKTQRVLNEERVNDRDLAQLEGQLREVQEAAKSSTAMQQLLTDMVNVLSSTTDGLQMLSDPNFSNRTEMLKLYRGLKRATGQPLHSESLLRWGAYILSKNAEVRDALLGAQFNATSEVRVAMNAYEHKLLADMEDDPVKTVKALLRERTKLVTDNDKAAFAWRQIHRDLLDRLGNFDALEEANTVATSILADPDYKALRKEIAKDGGTVGVNLGGKAPKVANAYSAGTIVLPDGTEFDIEPLDLVGSKTRFQAVRTRYEVAKAVYEPWLADPANMDDPNYRLHQRNFEEITSYYLALGVMQPSDKNFVFKRSFNILQQAVRLAGGRVAAGAKKALGQLQWEQHQAAAWTQKYTHLLSSAMQRAIDSHSGDLPEGGIHDKNTEYYRRHGNQLRASFNRQAGGLAVGDKTGSGWTVTPADMALVKLESDAVSEAFKILGDTQLTVDTLAGVTILRHALKGNPLMTTRGYTRDADIKTFVTQFEQAKAVNNEAEMLRLLDAWWGRAGHSFLWDRSADFARATPFDGPGGAFQVLAEQMANNPGSIRHTADLFQQLSALSTLTPDEAKAVVLQEFGRIIGDVQREIASDDKVQEGLRSEESKNSFTRSRNEAVGPYAFYDNGFRNTNSAESFGQNIVSRSFDRVVTALQAIEKDIDRQIQEFQTQVEQRVAQGVPTAMARNQVQAKNAAERRNGETYDNFKYLEWSKKVVNDVTKLLQNHTDLSDDLTFNRYVGALQGMLIGTIATFRNIGRSPIKLGQLQMRLGSNPIMATTLAGYYGYVDTGARMLSSLALSLLKTVYLIPKGIFLTARERTAFGKWWGKAMRPVVEEIGRTMYYRLKDVREAVARGELHIPDYLAQWDSTMAGLAMTQGRILKEELSKGTTAAQKLVSWVEKYVLSLQKMLMPMFGDTWANIAVNSAMESRFGVFRMWETQLRRLQKEFRGKVRFNFNNVQDPLNRISPQEMFNKRPWVADRAMLNIRNAFAEAGMDFDEKAVKFIEQLEQGNPNAEFLNEAERSRLKSSQIDYANRASIVNQPLHLQQKNPLVTFFKPFMQWPTRMTSHLIDELSIPAQLPKAARSGLDALKMRSVQVGVMMATLGLVAILSSITAAGDEEGNRALKKALFNQITGFRQPWERDNPMKGWGVYAMASVPFLEAVASIALSDTASRASLDPSLVVMEKAKDIIRYMGGAVQTGDWTYRLPELIGGLFPDAKIVLNRLESQEGKRELNNIVALARRHGPTEMIRPPGTGSGGVQATPLSPYADRMVAAAMTGDTAEVKRVYDEAVMVAREMGKTDPEGSVQQMFEGRNPYTRVFRSQLTDQQRQEFLSRLSPTERAEVEDVEQRFADGASVIGATARFQKTARATAQAPSGRAPASRAGVSIPSAAASSGASSRRLPRLSAVGAATVTRRPAGIRRRAPRLARGVTRRSAVRRIRGPRLSRFV